MNRIDEIRNKWSKDILEKLTSKNHKKYLHYVPTLEYLEYLNLLPAEDKYCKADLEKEHLLFMGVPIVPAIELAEAVTDENHNTK